MKHFTGIQDVSNPAALVQEALELKKNPFAFSDLGKNKTLGLLFLNPSLRTRLSTQKAALNLGMNVIVSNLDKDSWAIEMKEGAVMNGHTVEHIREAAAVMGKYFDIIGIRCFAKLQDRAEDEQEEVLQKFIQYSGVPVLSLESATRHPLQSLADRITIEEYRPKKRRPKVVLAWAPHVKPLPQAVVNSFTEWMRQADADFVITHPEGYELNKKFTGGTPIVYDQKAALKDADFVYAKNWSSYQDYGKILCSDSSWMLTNEKLSVTNHAKIMHCLPVRRGIELSDEVLNGKNSLVLEQAANRVFAAQVILKKMLEADLKYHHETAVYHQDWR